MFGETAYASPFTYNICNKYFIFSFKFFFDNLRHTKMLQWNENSPHIYQVLVENSCSAPHLPFVLK